MKPTTFLFIGMKTFEWAIVSPRRLALEDVLGLFVELGALGLVGGRLAPSGSASSNSSLHQMRVVGLPIASQPSSTTGSCPGRRCRRSSRAGTRRRGPWPCRARDTRVHS